MPQGRPGVSSPGARLLPIFALLPLVAIPFFFAPDSSRAMAFGVVMYFSSILAWAVIRKIDGARLMMGGKGALAGLVVAYLSSPLWYTVAQTPRGQGILLFSIYLSAAVIGAAVAFEKLSSFGVSRDMLGSDVSSKICDTSVLIDGRIADMAQAGFVEGELIIPEFILRELQGIADSSEQLKRNRGRRGLDIVQRLKDTPGVSIRLSTKDFPDEREVDHKLILLAAELGASLVTNDFNLNKLARVKSIKVLNLNDLVNALKTIFLPGEEISIVVSRAGKEHGQGIAYLDDGTMVVVDGGAPYVSRQVKVVVTNIHQTTAGRMIFTRFEEVVSRKSEERAV